MKENILINEKFSKFFLGLVLLFSLSLQAQDISPSEQIPESASWSTALNHFKKGSYLQSIKEFQKLETDEKFKSMAFYFQGLCYNKLQEFDKAAENFQKATDAGISVKDIHYENGQSLYAMNELKKARQAFARSIANNYLVPTSNYYIGFISQTLNQYQLALKFYKKIPPQNKDISQAASVQVGEIILAQAKKRKDTKLIVQKYVLAQMEKAYKIDETSNVAADIQKRIQEIKDLYDLDEDKMVNGRKISPRRHSVKFQEAINYDTNVITEAEEAASKVTPEFKESYISKSNLTYQHTFPYKRRFIFIPEMKLTFDHHFRRNAPEIHKNDNYTIVPKLESKLEHVLFKNMATISLEGEFSYQAKDVRKNHQLSFYGRTTTITIGEKFKFLSIGESSVKIKRKQFEGQTDALDSHTDGLALTQTVSLPNQHLFLGLLSADLTTLPRDDNSSSNSYVLRFDYIVPNIYKEFRLSGAMNFTLLDTKKQGPTRGLEKTYAPSISVTKTFFKILDVTGKYDYTKNVSKAKSTNAYTKSVYALELLVKY